ncbi:hypothetical protein [Protofrankia sp. BMG5.30]|uniref:hypothetical protein n=1 Tax=Protofrankia sp. BMG5.30 TaxID=1834514 RepID=UPI000977612B|nr:hypothetical protein [Protofrankia sp. BMG5.30]ONH33007.1 hypothetical protein BL254_20885 [Protofrankia sp. BMG5.30]
MPTEKIPAASSAVTDRAGKAVTQAATLASTMSERAGQQIDRTRSQRATSREEKVRAHTEKTQHLLEQQLARAEHKLQRIHRRRRRGMTAILLVGAGAASAAAAARGGVRQPQQAGPDDTTATRGPGAESPDEIGWNENPESSRPTV